MYGSSEAVHVSSSEVVIHASSAVVCLSSSVVAAACIDMARNWCLLAVVTLDFDPLIEIGRAHV